MTKKKRTLYLLLGVVAIYAAIVVRFIMLSNDSSSLGLIDASSGEFKPAIYKAQEKFTIINNYKDPFLNTPPRGKNRVASSSNSKKNSEPSTYYPQVYYLGVIADAKTSEKVLSLKVNGREYVVREGKNIDSLIVISGTSKKAVVSYKGKRKIIHIASQ